MRFFTKVSAVAAGSTTSDHGRDVGGGERVFYEKMWSRFYVDGSLKAVGISRLRSLKVVLVLRFKSRNVLIYYGWSTLWGFVVVVFYFRNVKSRNPSSIILEKHVGGLILK